MTADHDPSTDVLPQPAPPDRAPAPPTSPPAEALPQGTPARKRGTARHAISARARLRPLDSHEAPLIDGEVRDISLGGCRVLCAAPLRTGSLWEVQIPVSEAGSERTMLALVRWSSALDEAHAQVGLQFLADPGLLGAVGLSTSDLSAARSELAGAGPAPWDVTFNLTAPKSLAVKALESTTLRVAQHLEVTSSVKNSVLDIAGKLLAGTATLAGGRTFVMGSAEIGELGSPSATPTQVTLGRSLTASLLLAAAGPTLAQIDGEIDADALRLTELRARPSESLSPQERESVTVALYELQAKRQRRARIAANIDKLRSWDGKRERLRLRVPRWVHPGVTIRMGDASLTVDRPIEGPCTFTLSPQGQVHCECDAQSAEAAGAGGALREAA